jgi:uncharacterized repeat protein (TIGR03803 family)
VYTAGSKNVQGVYAMRQIKQAARFGRPGSWKTACVVGALCAATAIVLPAQTFTTLHSFDQTDGAFPGGALVQATDGNLYGTTADAGPNGRGGTIFKITPSGTLTTLYNFCSQSNCTDGESPFAAPVQATNWNVYGTTDSGGASLYDGTIFKITQSGTLTTLYSFCALSGCTDGIYPNGLIQAADGNLYGTTNRGGIDGGGACQQGCGTVFKITPSGTLTTLYNFCMQGGEQCTDGQYPSSALIQGSDGNLYGTTHGATFNYGSVFKITSNGTLTKLYSFCPQQPCTDGEYPSAALVQASDGNFYGTTTLWGAHGNNIAGGTVFKINPSGTLTTLHSFCSLSGCADGSRPYAALIQGTDGNLYGTTQLGGANNHGTIFKITRFGTLTTLYSFCSQINCSDGGNPYASLIQDTNGAFYGTTSGGGTGGHGSVFSLSVGLGPFVETRPPSGNVGKTITVLGSSLKGATSVTFNGTAATFIVDSNSFITTTVPAGATSGTVQVVTPGGTLSSNVPFRVSP